MTTKHAVSSDRTNGSKRGKGRASAKAPGNGRSKGSYDVFKEFEGQRYTGMKIGRGHKWRYDEGDWIEKKITPEKWEIRFTTMKRRRGHAPEGSGVPVGTEYHWYVLADQTAKKVDANNYQTDMVGHKFKLAHKRADKETWSASESAQRRRLVKILKQMIVDLERGAAEATPPAATAKSETAARSRSTHASSKVNGSKAKTRRAAKAQPATKRRAANGRHLAAA